MGLMKTIELPSGIIVKDAYFRIKTTVIEWDVGIIRLILGCWTSREASKMGKEELLVDGLDLSIFVPDLDKVGGKGLQYNLIKEFISRTDNHLLKDSKDVFEEENKEEI